MKNAKTFAKRIQKARSSFSCMGQMLVDMEIENMSVNDLYEVQDALANMNARNYAPLEKQIARILSAETVTAGHQ